MTDLLLITESERLRTIFSRLDDGSSFRLRHANSLEKAAEQLEADEPGFVFVQASFGSPADILLKYQQNASGQTRTRFVLLESAQETSGEVRLHYQGFLDISQDDETLLENIRALIASPSTASDTPGHLVSAPSSTPAIVSQREAGAFRTFAGLQEEKEAAGESSLWSKRGAFMLWLIPVVIAIIIVPMLQKNVRKVNRRRIDQQCCQQLQASRLLSRNKRNRL